MLNETILEMPYCQLNYGKNKLEVILFGGGLRADFDILIYLICHKLICNGFLGVLNTLLASSYPRGKDYDKKSYGS